MIDWRQIGQNYVDLRRDRDLQAADAQSTTRFFSNFRLFPVFCQLVGSILSSCKEGAEVHQAVFLWYHKYFLAYFIETLPRAHRARGIESSNFIECLKLKISAKIQFGFVEKYM